MINNATPHEHESTAIDVIKESCSGTVEQRRAKLCELENVMKQEEQLEIPVEHMYHGNIYIRCIMIPAEACVVGRIHLFDHFEILMEGDITVSTDEGDPIRYMGYAIMKGKAGKKRAFYAHKDSVFMTVHAAEEREPNEMWDYMTCGTFKEYEAFHAALEDYQKRTML